MAKCRLCPFTERVGGKILVTGTSLCWGCYLKEERRLTDESIQRAGERLEEMRRDAVYRS